MTAIRRALPAVTIATLQSLIVVGGIALTLRLERGLVVERSSSDRSHAAPVFYRTQGGGVGFSLTEHCSGTPTPPFEMGAALLAPFLLAAARSAPGLVLVRLRA